MSKILQNKILLIAFAFSIYLPMAAHANIITVTAEGSNPTGGSGHALVSSDTMSISYSYDTSLTPLNAADPINQASWWNEEITSTGTIAGHDISATREQITMFYSELGSSSDKISFQHNPNGGTAAGYDNFTSGIYTHIWSVALSLTDNSKTAWDGMDFNVLPTVLDPNAFGHTQLTTRLRDSSFNYTDVFWTVDSVTVTAVPEPSTMLLLGIGLVGLVGASVRRKFRKNKT